LAAREFAGDDWAGLLEHLERVGAMLEATRPTAVNLSWAVQRMLTAARIMALTAPIESAAVTLLALAHQMADEDVAVNRRMGFYGAALVPDEARVLTHCNAGALACVDYGTAIGVIRSAAEQGKRVSVFVDETRPFLQGARLTAWELQQAALPVTLIADAMAGHFISRGRVDLVVVGADRVAANGDVANKIGTYTLAVLCKENEVPFYVAAPTSTIDLAVPDGAAIPIEERSPEEVTHLAGQPIAPPGVGVANPAFDVTPARYVTAIITEHGVCRPPYEESLREAAMSASLIGALPGQAVR
jgi:methylthioribose-1-phosphate isomerase